MDDVAVLVFTSELAQLSARDFAALVVEELRMKLLVVGSDFALGRGREGTTDVLAGIGGEMGFAVDVVALLAASGEADAPSGKVGSTAVRQALARGDMETAASLLGRPFALRGPVIKGAERGKGLGFPTANMAFGQDRALPAFGVYVTRAYLREGVFPAVTNIGLRPTFGEDKPTVETFILDFQGEVYGQELRIELAASPAGRSALRQPRGPAGADREGRGGDEGVPGMTSATVPDDKRLRWLLRRAVAEIIPEEEFAAALRSGRSLRLKQGLDPSAPDLTLGHVVGLRKLRQFQELGHQVVLIVGDWTARIGDPSGQSQTRPMLTAEQVKANAETYMHQFFKVVDKASTEVRWQSEWFDKFDLADVIRLTARFTVAQMLQRDDFAQRFAEHKPIAIHEFLYPLLQAYDSVAIEADVEFGGTDQKFNLLVGRELQQMMGQPPQQCFLVPLLVGTDGRSKMSKSLGNYIAVDDPPDEMYGKMMSMPDAVMMDYFELVTDVPDEELAEMQEALRSPLREPHGAEDAPGARDRGAVPQPRGGPRGRGALHEGLPPARAAGGGAGNHRPRAIAGGSAQGGRDSAQPASFASEGVGRRAQFQRSPAASSARELSKSTAEKSPLDTVVPLQGRDDHPSGQAPLPAPSVDVGRQS